MNKQIHQLFKQAQDRYGIQGKELAELIGISRTHLSGFRSGKVWLSADVFMKMLDNMEKLAPGSRKYFCQLLAEESLNENTTSMKDKLVEMIECANDDEIEAALFAIGRKWKCSRQQSASMNEGEEERQAIAQSAVPKAIAV